MEQTLEVRLVTTTPAGTTAALRLGSQAAFVSGVAAAFGIAFLIAMFVAFGVGSTSAGQRLGRINDVLVLLAYLLAGPVVFAVHALLRSRAPLLSGLAVLIGIGAIVAIVVLQSLLIFGVLTFEEQVGPVSIALLVLGVWFVLTGYLGSSTGVLPHGVRMGLLAATYVGYPIWAFWLGRRLHEQEGTTTSASPASDG